MSRRAGQTSYYRFTGQNLVENVENVDTTGPGRVKDGNFDTQKATKMSSNRRPVLGSITNNQFGPPLPPKQSYCESYKRDSCMQTNVVLPAHTDSFWTTASTAPRPAVDLSCHETDHTMLIHSAEHSDNTLDDSHCSPILLDMSSDEDESDDVDSAAAATREAEQNERLDRLLCMAEYDDEIYTYLRKAELSRRPRSNYMHRQTDITANMRSILVDWLVEVAEEYHLHCETLFLAVNYIDRFLSVMAVQRSKLQLVGTSAMFIAAKFEEIYPPEVNEFVYITDDTYTTQQVLRMEHLLLKVLTFDVAVPTTHTFTNRFLKQLHADDRTVSLAMYLSELSLLDGEVFLQYVPSIVAASAVCLSNITLSGSQRAWTSLECSVTGYQLSDIACCVRDLHQLYLKSSSLQQRAIHDKYQADKFQHVSLIPPPLQLPV